MKKNQNKALSHFIPQVFCRSSGGRTYLLEPLVIQNDDYSMIMKVLLSKGIIIDELEDLEEDKDEFLVSQQFNILKYWKDFDGKRYTRGTCNISSI